MSSKIAHNLEDNKWRSEDIRISIEDNKEESDVTFSSLNLKPNVFLGLKRSGFMRPSLIQLQAIPLGRCGLDLIVQSKSGTGKTCVFVVIALEMIESKATQVLIISPTREIAVQIEEVVNALSSESPLIKCCSVIGGTKVKEDRDKLLMSQIVIGTPGRIKQLIELNLLKTNSIRLLVFDECDKLLDNNFKKQIDQIYESLPQNKQMIACSATMNTDLALFLSKYMRTPAFVRLNADNPALIGVQQYYRITQFHHLNHINFDNKIEPLIEILKKIPFSQCLVFSNYQTRARMLCDKLNANDWPTTYISAEKCQLERLKALSKLKKYKCRILVSTDLTARGIDVENINLVINMDVPFDAETYLHRIGRAGRFGSRGIAITIANNGRELELLQKIIKDCKLEVEELSQPIPENLWNSVQGFECFSHNANHEVSQNNESIDETESNPWDRFSHPNDLSNETSSKLISFNDIVNDYNLIKKSKEMDQKLTFGQTNGQNIDTIRSETDCDSIEDVFSDKCSINSNDSNLRLKTESIKLGIIKKCDEISLNSEESQKSSPSMSATNFENNNFSSLKEDLYDCNETQYYCNETESHYLNSDNQNTFENNCYNVNSSSANLIQSGLNQWAEALFPPISSVSARKFPQFYNEWVNKNKYLWSYMLDPFQAFQLTQNVNQNTFNNNQ